eukprot:12987570-Alexandrium_andersonii.AAC.1
MFSPSAREQRAAQAEKMRCSTCAPPSLRKARCLAGRPAQPSCQRPAFEAGMAPGYCTCGGWHSGGQCSDPL